jgi:hypothetical protein
MPGRRVKFVRWLSKAVNLATSKCSAPVRDSHCERCAAAVLRHTSINALSHCSTSLCPQMWPCQKWCKASRVPRQTGNVQLCASVASKPRAAAPRKAAAASAQLAGGHDDARRTTCSSARHAQPLSTENAQVLLGPFAGPIEACNWPGRRGLAVPLPTNAASSARGRDSVCCARARCTT